MFARFLARGLAAGLFDSLTRWATDWPPWRRRGWCWLAADLQSGFAKEADFNERFDSVSKSFFRTNLDFSFRGGGGSPAA